MRRELASANAVYTSAPASAKPPIVRSSARPIAPATIATRRKNPATVITLRSRFARICSWSVIGR